MKITEGPVRVAASDLADDSDALDAWEYAFAMVLDTTLEAADDSDPVVADDLDLEGHGPALVTRLFLSRRDGARITELAGALKDAATADLAAEEADRQWQEWVDAHGDGQPAIQFDAALLWRFAFGYSGVQSVIPIYIFIFLVALGVDYNIFLSARIREESRRAW